MGSAFTKPEVNPAVQKHINQFNAVEKKYKESAFHKTFEHSFQSQCVVNRIVIIGLGPSESSSEIILRTYWQIAFIRHIVQLLLSKSGRIIDIYTQENYQGLLSKDSKSKLPDTFDAFLQTLSFNILPFERSRIRDPKGGPYIGPAPDYTTPTTLFYAPDPPFGVTVRALLNKDPALYIGPSLDVLLRTLTVGPERYKKMDSLLMACNGDAECIEGIKKFKSEHIWQLPPKFDESLRDHGLLAVSVIYRRKGREFGLPEGWHYKDVPAMVMLERRLRRKMPLAFLRIRYPGHIMAEMIRNDPFIG